MIYRMPWTSKRYIECRGLVKDIFPSYPLLMIHGSRNQFIAKSPKTLQNHTVIDDAVSNTTNVCSGVPQGYILDPVLFNFNFNLCVNDLSENLDNSISSHQYADDTSIYAHCKPTDIKSCEEKIQSNLDKLSTWSSSNNLVLNPNKTKVMLFSLVNSLVCTNLMKTVLFIFML
jgi:hypothetical protein